VLSSSLFYHLFAAGASAVGDRLGLPFFFGLLPNSATVVHELLSLNCVNLA
jgi:hypothetical protein